MGQINVSDFSDKIVNLIIDWSPKLLLVIFGVVAFVLVPAVFSQEKEAKEEPKYGWQKEMVGNLNLTQTKFDNWAQGGEDAFAWQINLNLKFVNDQEKWTWSNMGKFSFGSTKMGDQESRKSIDEIKFESVYTYKLAELLNPFVAANGLTQFAPGYNYETESKTKISTFMDPGYFRESLGLGYKPNDIFQTRLGASMKQTITRNYPSPYADDPNTTEIEKTKNEIGAESVSDVSWKISDNTIFKSKLELFTTFSAFDETDVNWDNDFTTKISKYFNINFNFKLFYDKDISPKRQIKQFLGIGITYTFL